MSLVKLAYRLSAQELYDEYEDKRPLWRRAKGKPLGYTVGLPFAPLAPVLGHLADRGRALKDFKNTPKMFKKK